MNSIGEVIKQRRQDLNLTLEDVGDIVGVGKSTVRKWETGQIRNMRRDKIALLAKALSISPAVLVPSADNTEVLSSDETHLVTTYRSLTPHGKELLLERADELSILYGKNTESGTGEESEPAGQTG